jgi:GR25 family glycosyltransferase involved in LPS biosynthesis
MTVYGPTYYISDKKLPKYEKELSEAGFGDINHFQAIDGRSLDITNLARKNIVSGRAYNDIVYRRHQHTGISTMGTIGCFLSHLALWQLCVDKNLPYMVIAENDVSTKTFSPEDIQKINSTLSKPSAILISSVNNYKKGNELLFGAHLYFLTLDGAKKLLERALPIDMQLDSYIGYIGNIGDTDVQSYHLCDIVGITEGNKSTTHDYNCIKCLLPTKMNFYLILILSAMFMMVIILYLAFRWRKCAKTVCVL